MSSINDVTIFTKLLSSLFVVVFISIKSFTFKHSGVSLAFTIAKPTILILLTSFIIRVSNICEVFLLKLIFLYDTVVLSPKNLNPTFSKSLNDTYGYDL